MLSKGEKMRIYTTEELESMSIGQVENYYKKLHEENRKSIIYD
jgi:hypothetical protein